MAFASSPRLADVGAPPAKSTVIDERCTLPSEYRVFPAMYSIDTQELVRGMEIMVLIIP